MKKIRILVVDDEIVVREGIVTILSLHPDIEVVGEASDGVQALELTRKIKPDVILLDMAMPKQNGLATIPMLKELLPSVRILVLTSFAESDTVYRAIKAGASGYLLKDIRREQLIESIHDVANGLAVINPSIALKVIQDVNKSEDMVNMPPSLTSREQETLHLVAKGLTNQEIAETLSVSERTVAKYVSSILEKLQLANRTQAALYALREGLTEPKRKRPETENELPITKQDLRKKKQEGRK